VAASHDEAIFGAAAPARYLHTTTDLPPAWGLSTSSIGPTWILPLLLLMYV